MLNVSIVLYNSPIFEIKQIIKVLRLSTMVNQIFLVDNSPSRNPEIVNSDASYIYTEKNLGYGAAHNMAIKKTITSETKYHLILNPDIGLKEGIIEELIKYMDTDPELGLVMPKVLYPNGEIQYLCKLLPTPSDWIFRRFSPFRNRVYRRNERYELRFTGYNKEMEVPSLSGCFMFIRTSILEEIGGFDERFFMYAEDVDLCRRIGIKHKTVYNPDVDVIHNYEKGSYKNWKLLRYHIVSAIKYFNKWGWIFDNDRKKVNKETLNKLTS